MSANAGTIVCEIVVTGRPMCSCTPVLAECYAHSPHEPALRLLVVGIMLIIRSASLTSIWWRKADNCKVRVDTDFCNGIVESLKVIVLLLGPGVGETCPAMAAKCLRLRMSTKVPISYGAFDLRPSAAATMSSRAGAETLHTVWSAKGPLPG
jgi:hypothetical protein